MNPQKKFVTLEKSQHCRKSFDCGQVQLNNFIQTQALKHMNAGISKTVVLPSTEKFDTQKFGICSFYTMAPSTICRENLPEQLSKKLPRYPVPVFILAQLAVHLDCHCQGLGKVSLIHALKKMYEINTHMPAYAVIVDCLTDSIQPFYEQFGFKVLCTHNKRVRMFLPMKTIQQLFENS